MSQLTLKIFTLTLALLTFTALFADAPSYDENLPSSWFRLPEDSDSRDFDSSYSDLSQKQKVGIDRVMHSHQRALRHFDEISPKESRFDDWRMQACIVDVSLSASGVVGALVAKGEATAALYWRRSQSKDSRMPEEPVEAEFSTEDSFEDLEKRINPMAEAIFATGHVTDKPALKRNLKEKIFDSHEIIQYLALAPQDSWNVSRLRMDLTIDASGKITPVTTIGGGVRIRLDWMVKARTNTRLLATRAKSRQLGEGMKKIATDLVGVLHGAKFEDMAATGFSLREIKMGLGIFGEGNVGVVKLGGSLFGYLYLVPNSKYDGRNVPAQYATNYPVAVIDYSQNQKWTKWASSHEVPYEVYLSSRGEKTVVYETLADRFRAGLEKAVKMGNRFAESASHHRGAWEVYQLKTEFALSLSGDLTLFKLGGTGSIELVFG